jgi:P27 family predicted phage terminase small subunit
LLIPIRLVILMLNLDSIVGGEGCPPEPNWHNIFAGELDRSFAHQQWNTVIHEMHGGEILSIANGHAIKRLVEFRIQYENASRHVAEHGAILPAAKAKIGQHNPYWSVMRQADEAIKLLEAELGLSPVRRSKAVKITRAMKTARASDRYLRPA